MRFLTSTLSLFLATAVCLSAVAEEKAPNAAELEFFEKEVRPILIKRCYECHGEEKQESDLRLDSQASILNGSASGDVVDLDDPESSLLLRAISYQDEDYEMPPEGRMPDEEIAALNKWVELGLPWPKEDEPKDVPLTFDQLLDKHRGEHWAYQPVSNPKAPEVKQKNRVSNPIDQFVLKRLEEKNLSLSEEADRRTLIRRATYDLHGVPPTFAEVETFVQDKDPQAYEKLIDRLLASHRYGQQWGRHWLDIARYADTVGYLTGGKDNRYPYSYTYRDYVIDALNSDLPYHQFIKEQLAADYFVAEDDPKLAALGYITVGRKYLKSQETIDDRIDVVMRGFQALTVGCARCHNHKYDAISQADYYGLYGVFTSIETHEPLIGKPEETPGYDQFKAELDKLEAAISEYDKGIFAKIQKEVRTSFSDYFMLSISKKQEIELAKLPFATLKPQDIRKRILQSWRNYLARNAKPNHKVWAAWKIIPSIPEDQFAEKFPPHLEKLKIKEGEDGFISMNHLLRQRFLEYQPKSYPEFANVYGSLFTEVVANWDELGGTEEAKAKLSKDEQELLAAILQSGSPMLLGFDSVRLHSRRDENDKRQPLINKVNKHKSDADGAPKHAMAVKDFDRPREPVIFIRGNQARRGDRVPRQFMRVLAKQNKPLEPFKNGSGRLELAEHIIDSENPLTARVLVNRIWMHHFDQPLVATPSDFGVRSIPPSHPQLLDHLSSFVRQHNWSQKQLHKYIMLSSVYRQQSIDRPQARAIDSENQLFWKMNRRRLTFEEMRDSILAVTQSLDDSIGGKPVKILNAPYSTRRTVYGFIDRQDLPNLYRVFDFPNPDATSPKRSKTSVPQQALYMLNNEFVLNQAKQYASQVLEQGEPRAKMVDSFYQSVLQRMPSEQERKLAVQFIDAAVKQRETETKIGAVHQLAHALLQSNEFMFVD